MILALPFVYLAAGITLLTDSTAVSTVLGALVLMTFPYTVWVAARLMGFEFLRLARSQQLVAVAVVVLVGLLGWYVGGYNDRFVTCRDFIRMGEVEPTNCAD